MLFKLVFSSGVVSGGGKARAIAPVLYSRVECRASTQLRLFHFFLVNFAFVRVQKYSIIL